MSANYKPMRSFMLRQRQVTIAKQQAIDELWPLYGLDLCNGQIDSCKIFGRVAPLVIEIGFGMGQSLVTMAAAAPATNFVGIEVHRPGVGKLLHSMVEQGVDNIRVYCHDAVEVLRDCIPDASLDTVQIFFPDPWHKKKHNKRRLIQPPFLALVSSKLKPGGTLHLATDWENYAQQMLEVLGAAGGLENTCGPGQFAPRPEHRPLTKFELRGERLGHGVWDLVFRRS